MCLFNSNVRAGIIAHKLDDAESIFADKIKYPYRNLPEAIRKLVPTVKDDGGQLKLANNSSIRVSTSLRSGTYHLIHISEFGYICTHFPQKAKEIVAGALETAHEKAFIFIESTAEGPVGTFYEWCKKYQEMRSKKQVLTREDYKYHFFGWWENPSNRLDPTHVLLTHETKTYFKKLKSDYGIRTDRSQQAWYQQKKIKLSDLIYKEHPSVPDEAFRASIEGSYYGKLIGAARDQERIGFVPYDPAWPVHVFWDLGDVYTAMWFVQFVYGNPHFIDYYFNDESIGLQGYALALQEKKYVWGYHFAGPDIEGSNARTAQTTTTTKQVARELGIDFKVVPGHTIMDGIEAVRLILPKCRFDADKCSEGIKAIENYRKEWDDKLSFWKSNPLHDVFSHPADALRHCAVAYRLDLNGMLSLKLIKDQYKDIPQTADYDLLG
jgi:hypothetical protein